MSRRLREGIRASTEQPRKVPKGYRDLISNLYPDPVFPVERPKTRADCLKMPRPCPFVSCRHHLYLDTRDGRTSIKFNFPDKDPWDLPHSCSLDLSSEGAHTLDDVGIFMNMTRERIRQIEEIIFNRLGIDHQTVRAIIDTIGVKVQYGSIDPRGFNEDEMNVLETAARVAEIERQIEDLRVERRTLILHLEALSKSSPRILKDATGPDKPPVQSTPPKAPRKSPEAQGSQQEWVMSILKGGEWVPSRRLSRTMPTKVADGKDPKKLVHKILRTLVKDGLIENGKKEGRSRSWRLVG